MTTTATTTTLAALYHYLFTQLTYRWPEWQHNTEQHGHDDEVSVSLKWIRRILNSIWMEMTS
jgi:hypothetical protein